jgi:hypothetical protein
MSGRRAKEQDDLWHRRGFASGIAVACATMVGTWGEEVAAEEIMSGVGLDTRAKMKALGVDDYDLDQLKPVFQILRRRRARAKRR